MKRLNLLLALVSLYFVLAAYGSPRRPDIFRIAWVRLRVADVEKTRHFYKDMFELREFPGTCIIPEATCFWVNFGQKVEIRQALESESTGLDAVGFWTADVKKMRRYLLARGLRPTEIAQGKRGVQYFEVHDFENHVIAFMNSVEGGSYVFSPITTNMIHAGFVVHGRAAEDRFYKDILGFHVYWHGGRKDDETSWVDMQVPDGTDWIEYMLNVPANADHRTLGGANHIALGVPDIHAAEAQLRKNGWSGNEQPKIGRGGKWQLNLFDPDDTRVELMEFTPAQKPCCSEYTGPHPGPKP